MLVPFTEVCIIWVPEIANILQSMVNFILWVTLIFCLRFQLTAQLPASSNPLNGQHIRIIWTRWGGNPKGLSGPLKSGVIIDFLSARFNFTYEMVRVTEHYLEPTANGKGLFSFLFENKSDLLAEAMLPLNERNKVVDFTLPWSFDFYTVLIPAPEMGTNTNAIIKPFQWQVWLSLGISIVLVIIVLNQTHRLLTISNFKKELSNTTISPSCGKTNPSPGQYLYVFGNLLSQGGPCKDKRLSFRLVAGCWILAAFVLVQAYTSILFTYVVVPVNSPLINSFEDIAEKNDVKLIVMKNIGVDIVISNTNHSTELSKKLFKKLNSVSDSRCNLISECVGLVKPGSKNVFLEGRPYLLDAIKQRYEKTGKCDMQIIKQSFYNFMAHFALPKKSPYTPSISKGILELQQIGLIDHWDSWFRPMPPKCNTYAESKQSTAGKYLSPLSIRNLTGAFAVLAVGFTISSLFFLTELLMSYLRQGFCPN